MVVDSKAHFEYGHCVMQQPEGPTGSELANMNMAAFELFLTADRLHSESYCGNMAG